MTTLLEKVKANLILEHDAHDELLGLYITAATRYAQGGELLQHQRHAAHYRTGRHHAVVPLLRVPGRQHGRLLFG